MRRTHSQYCPPANAPAAQQRAIEYAECVVCFDDMYKEQSGVWEKGGKRACPHFLHLRCAETVRQSSRGGKCCPICRADFDSVRPIPAILDDPRAWFKAVDLNGDGKLTQREVAEVLKAQLPIDFERFQEELPQLWSRWDIRGDDVVSEEEFLDPQRGLLAYVQSHFPRKQQQDEIPDIKTDREAWFSHFDYDGSGTLEEDEIVRALIKTFRLSEDNRRMASMKDIVHAVWGVFDFDQSGSILLSEFCKPGDGLADAIIAAMDGV